MKKKLLVMTFLSFVSSSLLAQVPDKEHFEVYAKGFVDRWAAKFGQGNDEVLMQKIITINNASRAQGNGYLFALEPGLSGVIRHATPGHIGEYLNFKNYPHTKDIVNFAEHYTSGWITYDATKTPDNCAQKKSYVYQVTGDSNKIYVLGLGYCL